MAIENPNDRGAEEKGVEFLAKLKGINTTEIDWNTKTAYDVTLRSLDAASLSLGTLKPGTILKVRITVENAPQQANKQRQAR